MPELPEVEVTRRSFADRIRGATVLDARAGLPLRWPLGVAPQALAGQRELARSQRYSRIAPEQAELVYLRNKIALTTAERARQ